MATPKTAKLKVRVKVHRIGRYAGPSVNDPQFETTSANEEVEVTPDFAAFLVKHGSGEVVAEKKEPETETETETETLPPAPGDVDKDKAETATPKKGRGKGKG